MITHRMTSSCWTGSQGHRAPSSATSLSSTTPKAYRYVDSEEVRFRDLSSFRHGFTQPLDWVLQKIANAIKRDKDRVRTAVQMGRNDILPLHLACAHKSFAAGRVLVEILNPRDEIDGGESAEERARLLRAAVNPRLPEYFELRSTPLHLLLENAKPRYVRMVKTFFKSNLTHVSGTLMIFYPCSKICLRPGRTLYCLLWRMQTRSTTTTSLKQGLIRRGLSTTASPQDTTPPSSQRLSQRWRR